MNTSYQHNNILVDSNNSINEPMLSFNNISSTQSQNCQTKSCRVVLYQDILEQPKISIIPFCDDIKLYLENISSYVIKLLNEIGSPFENSIIAEMVSNFIHSDFMFPTIIIANQGHTLIFGDQGRGFSENTNQTPYYSQTTSEKKKYIRGLGLGLPLVKALLNEVNGTLTIHSNNHRGTIITLDIPQIILNDLSDKKNSRELINKKADNNNSPHYYLNSRQQATLTLVGKTGETGPSIISKVLGVALSTAHRDLKYLEAIQLITSNKGKRTITESGMYYLSQL